MNQPKFQFPRLKGELGLLSQKVEEFEVCELLQLLEPILLWQQPCGVMSYCYLHTSQGVSLSNIERVYKKVTSTSVTQIPVGVDFVSNFVT